MNSIILDVAQRLKSAGIKTLILRSDNAGNFHTQETLLAMHRISELSGVTIERWSYSETQTGKSACDRMAAMVKRQVEKYVDQRNNVGTESEFFTSLTTENDNSGFKSLLPHKFILLVTIDGETTKRAKSSKRITGIRSLSDFTFETDKMTARKFADFGTGQQIKYADYNIPIIQHFKILRLADNDVGSFEASTIIVSSGHSTLYWKLPMAKQKQIHSTNLQKIFDCPGIF